MSTSTPLERYLAAESAQELKTARQECVEEWLRRYGKPGTTAENLDPQRGHEFARRADRLMREWNPIGFGARQLHRLMGQPQHKRDGRAVYRFTIGPVQQHWEFQIDERDVVVGVEFVPGE